MTMQVKDRVLETSTSTGTGAFTLAGAVTGYRAFSAVCSTSDTCPYAIVAVDGSGVPTGDWEVGTGTYSGANTLTRTKVLASSNANAAVSFAAGTKQVFLDMPAAYLSSIILTLTDAGTIAWDMSQGYNAKVTLSTSRTMGTPTNPIEGMTYSLSVKQSATGNCLVTWPSAFDWGDPGAPVMSTAANKRDRVTLICTDAATPKFDAFLSGKGFT